MIVELMRESSDYKIPCGKRTFYTTMANMMGCNEEKAKQYIADCVEEFELFKTDGDFLWSDSLLHRMQIKDDLRKKRSAAGTKAATSRWNTDTDKIANVKQTHNKRITNVQQNDAREKKRKKENTSKDIIRSTNLEVSKINVNKKENIYSQFILNGFLEKWNTLNITTHSTETVKRKIQKKHLDTIKLYGEDTILKALDSYVEVLRDKKYYYDSIFTLWRFLEKVEDFLPEAKPLVRFLDKKQAEKFPHEDLY